MEFKLNAKKTEKKYFEDKTVYYPILGMVGFLGLLVSLYLVTFMAHVSYGDVIGQLTSFLTFNRPSHFVIGGHILDVTFEVISLILLTLGVAYGSIFLVTALIGAPTSFSS